MGLDFARGPALIVAEIGNNHEGDFEAAKKLVLEAYKAGADAVKFQTFVTERFVSRADPERFKRLKSFELAPERFAELARLARASGLLFISTPLDLGSCGLLAKIADAIKIASGDNDFYPLLARAAASGKPLIVSTGLSGLPQVRRTVSFLRARKALARTALLHCVTSYPVPPEQAQLKAIPALARAFPGVPIGYSDHTVGCDAVPLAVALGARIIEKHFTLDKNQSDFRDHKISADPAELAEIVRRVRAAEALLGSAGKTVQPCEQALLGAARRSIAAARDLPRGHRLKGDDLAWLRPASGLPPGKEALLIGKSLKRAVRSGEALSGRDVK